MGREAAAMTSASRTKLFEVAADLQGTAQDLDTVLEDHGLTFAALTVREARQLDSIVMLCDGCGWWVEADEVDEDSFCGDCRDDD